LIAKSNRPRVRPINLGLGFFGYVPNNRTNVAGQIV